MVSVVRDTNNWEKPEQPKSRPGLPHECAIRAAYCSRFHSPHEPMGRRKHLCSRIRSIAWVFLGSQAKLTTHLNTHSLIKPCARSDHVCEISPGGFGRVRNHLQIKHTIAWEWVIREPQPYFVVAANIRLAPKRQRKATDHNERGYDGKNFEDITFPCNKLMA